MMLLKEKKKPSKRLSICFQTPNKHLQFNKQLSLIAKS